MGKHNKRMIKGFTLVEILIVVAIIGIIAGFGLPGYEKMVRKAHERNAILGLTSIHQANSVYEAKMGVYLSGTGLTLALINSGLSIDVKALSMTYAYTRNGGDPLLYTATSVWAGGGAFTVLVDERSLALGGNNPCCSAGTCPSLPAC